MLETENKLVAKTEQGRVELPNGYHETRLLSLEEIGRFVEAPVVKGVISLNGANIYQEKDQKTKELLTKIKIEDCEKTWPEDLLGDIKSAKIKPVIPLTNPDSSTIIVKDGFSIHFVYGAKKGDPTSGMSFWVSISKDSLPSIGSQPLISIEDCAKEGIPAKVYEAAEISRGLSARNKQTS